MTGTCDAEMTLHQKLIGLSDMTSIDKLAKTTCISSNSVCETSQLLPERVTQSNAFFSLFGDDIVDLKAISDTEHAVLRRDDSGRTVIIVSHFRLKMFRG